MVESSPRLGERIAAGAAWMILMRFAIRGIGIVSTIILARLLVPADFGLVALATMFAGLLEVVSEFNFAIYLIREQKAGRSDYDTAWTLSIIRGVLLALVLALSAPYASEFFEKPALEAIIYCLAAVTLVGGFENIGVVEFRKSLNFRREFRFSVSVKLASFLVTMILAFLLRSYWALVIGLLSGRVARLLLSYVMHPFRPRFCLAGWAKIMGFSKWILANGVLAFLANRSDVFVIGKITGAAALGLYSVGQEIAMLATSELVMPIHRALLPGYAKIAHDKEALRRGYVDALALIVMLAVPVAAGVALVAEPLVGIVLGRKWLESVPLIQVLAIAGVLKVFRANSNPMLIAMGFPQLTTALAAAVTIVVIPLLIWWTTVWGVLGAAWAVAASTIAGVLLNFVFVIRIAGIRPSLIVAAVWRSIVSTAVMVLVVTLALESLPTVEPPGIISLAVGLTSGVASYAGTQLALWRLAGSPDGPERQALNVLGARLRGRVAQ